jgi:23S rRNA maturation-related 3'-5' exoribonuclease YhaM
MDPKQKGIDILENEVNSEEQSETESTQSAQLKTINLGKFNRPSPSQQFQPNVMYSQNPQQMQMNFMNSMMNMMYQMPMNFMVEPTISKKSNNEKPFVSLTNYDDSQKIRNAFPSCSSYNDANFAIDNIKNAEFYILRSTNDDDLHKVRLIN